MKSHFFVTIIVSYLLLPFDTNGQTYNIIEPSDTISDLFEIQISEYIRAYDAYFDALRVYGVDLDSCKEYKHYTRTIEALRYASNFPNFSFKDYASDYQDWILANGNINSCVINSQFPYLSFEEIGPVNHVLGTSPQKRGTGQIHYVTWNPFNLNEMYACSNYGGLFKSTDMGDNWFHPLPFHHLALVILGTSQLEMQSF